MHKFKTLKTFIAFPTFIWEDIFQLLFGLTLALLMVGDHQRVKRRLGIWLRPDLWALVSFFHFMDSSKPLAFSLKHRKTIDAILMECFRYKTNPQIKKAVPRLGEGKIDFSVSSVFSPEETLPGREISAFEECVLQDSLHTTQSLDHVCAVVVQVPQFAIVPLVGPPEWILLQHLDSQSIERHINIWCHVHVGVYC